MLQSVIHGMADGLVVADLSGRFRLFNPAAERILGVGLQDVDPADWSRTYGCFLPDTVTPFPAEELPLARALAGEEVRAVEIFVQHPQREGGTWISASATPWRDESGEPCGGIVVFRDITQQKAARASVERLSAAVEQTADGIVITDVRGTIVYVNPAFEQISGYSRDEALGQTPRLLKSGEHDDAFYHDLWQTVLAGGAFKGTLVNRRKNGERFHSEQTITPIKGADGKPIHLVSVFKDITERRRIEKHQLQMELARVVQQRLYPATAPHLPGFDIAGADFAAETMSGDYFDFLPMADDRLGIVVGDVSGHGIGPSLVMVETRAYLRSLALIDADLGALLEGVNAVLASDFTMRWYVTLLLVRIDPRTRRLDYASAGHLPGFVFDRDGQVRAELKSTGIPLGIYQGRRFPSPPAITLEAGDMIVLYTDGVTETLDPDGTEFGIERVVKFVAAHRHRSARAIVEGLCRAVRRFARDAPQVDDMTVVVCKVTETSPTGGRGADAPSAGTEGAGHPGG